MVESPPGNPRSATDDFDLLARLQMVAADCAGATDVDDLFTVALAQSASGTGAHSAVLYIDRGRRLDLVRARNLDLSDLAAWRTIPLDAEVPLAEAMRTREPVWVASAGQRADQFPDLAAHDTGFVSTASLPLIVQGRAIGVLGVAWRSAYAPSPAERLFLLALADQVAMSLSRLRYVAARPGPASLDWAVLTDPDRQRATESLWDLDDAARAGVDRLTALAARLCDAPVAQVSLLGEHQYVAGLAGAVCAPADRFGPLEDSLCAVTVSTQAPLEVTDAHADERVNTLPPVTSGAVGSYLGVPLRSRGELIGALCVHDPAARGWRAGSTAILEDLAQAVVSELELHAAGRQQREAARRAGLLHRFAWELARANSPQQVAAALAAGARVGEDVVGALVVVPAAEDQPLVVESEGFTAVGHRSFAEEDLVVEVGRLVEAGRTAHLADPATIAAAVPALLPEMVALSVRSVAIVPVPAEQTVIAALLVALSRPGGGADLDEHLGQLATAAGAAMARALLTARHAAAQARTAFLAEASVQMEESLDVAETLQRVARMAVPALADVCEVRLFTGTTDRVVAAAHVNGQQEAAVRAGEGPYRALAEVAAQALSTQQVATADAAVPGLGAIAAAPLRARGRAVGTITLARSSGTGRLPLPAGDFLTDLARRAAIAIDNAMLYQQRNDTVMSLQRRLLPPSLPRLAGLDLAACYETAEADLDVGGDFYDAIVQPDGSLVLVIGDVCGRGAEAASITGLARHTLRTVLGDGATPGQALTRLNRAMIEDGTGDRFCTAVLVQVRETGGGAELTVASGGHPLPYVVRADGRVEEVGVPGQLLGVFPQIRLKETRVDLRDGEALLLYTDGVTEARGEDGLFGPQRLADTLTGAAGLPAGALVQHVRAAVLDYQVSGSDDIAMIVLRLRGRELLRREFPGVPQSAGAARRAVSALVRDELPALAGDTVHDLTLAVNELVTNAVVHGGGAFELTVSRLANGVRVEVASTRSPFAVPERWPGADDESGRGILLATGLTDRTAVWHDERTLAWVEVDIPRG